jgi:hypothetical protein
MTLADNLHLISLILQLIGIWVTLGFLFDHVIKAPPIKALHFIFNSVEPAIKLILLTWYGVNAGKRVFPEYILSDRVGDLYKQASQPLAVILPLFVVIVSIPFSLSPMCFLVYGLYHWLKYNIWLNDCYWLLFKICLCLLTYNYLLALGVQLAITKKQTELRKIPFNSKTHNALRIFLRNYYAYPWALVKVLIPLLMVFLLVFPAWFIKLIFQKNLIAEDRRRNYHLWYSAITLSLSILLEIIVFYLQIQIKTT